MDYDPWKIEPSFGSVLKRLEDNKHTAIWHIPETPGHYHEWPVVLLNEITVDNDEYDLIKTALEKQLPKKPICKIYKSENIYLGTSKNYYCPTCNNGLIWVDDNHCKDCGQALDWSE